MAGFGRHRAAFRAAKKVTRDDHEGEFKDSLIYLGAAWQREGDERRARTATRRD
jgi:hypothetical protein